LILISASLQTQGMELRDTTTSLADDYAQAVLDAGGLPWIMPMATEADVVAELVRRAGGVLLTGGDDVQPELFAPGLSHRLRQTVRPVHPRRDLQDLLLIAEVFRQQKPLLAICRGLQILNVALGGTLIVDLAAQRPRAFNHARPDRKHELVHEATLTPGSQLAREIPKSPIGVNSTHHQAVGRVAGLLRVSARSADGVIEGLELRPAAAGRLPFLLAVQYHPERLYRRFPEHRALFTALVRVCARPSK
jgi:putative glutamine amidotransferase